MTSENLKECFPVRVVSSHGTNFDEKPIEGKDSVYPPLLRKGGCRCIIGGTGLERSLLDD